MQLEEDRYRSKAELIKIRNFRLAEFSHLKEDEQGNCIPFFSEQRKVLTPIMPTIIQSNGEVWEISSLYFIKYLSINGGRDYKTLLSIAYDLLDFYRFIEDCQHENVNFDWLYLPLEEEDRVINRYVSNLDRIYHRNLIKGSTRSKKINSVVNFYKFSFKHKLFDKGVIKNGLPFQIIARNIRTVDSLGFSQIREVETTNLARPIAKKKDTVDGIKDGRVLHPIEPEYLSTIMQTLENHPSRAFQLFFKFALETGARSQTISTIRVKHIKKILMQNTVLDNRLKLTVGNGTSIDSKFSSEIAIYIPYQLCLDLIKFTESQTWKNAARRSYYDLTDNNYIFLTKKGTPYYTSKQEIDELENSDHGLDQNIAVGGTLRSQLISLIKMIKAKHPNFPNFSLHDLRATFALNSLKKCMDLGWNNSQSLLHIKKLLGHESTKTTERYLNYYYEIDSYNSAQKSLEKRFLKPLNVQQD